MEIDDKIIEEAPETRTTTIGEDHPVLVEINEALALMVPAANVVVLVANVAVPVANVVAHAVRLLRQETLERQPLRVSFLETKIEKEEEATAVAAAITVAVGITKISQPHSCEGVGYVAKIMMIVWRG